METKVKTLLEQALEAAPLRPRRKGSTEEEIELLFAYLSEKISAKQIGIAIGNPSGITNFVGKTLLAAYRQGLIVKNEKWKTKQSQNYTAGKSR